MFNRISYPTDAQDVVIGQVTLEDFGHRGTVSIEEAYNTFRSNGVILLPQTTVAKFATLNHKKFKPGDWGLMYMDPIVSGGRRVVFSVERFDGGEFWVFGRIADPGRHVNAISRWFVGLLQTS